MLKLLFDNEATSEGKIEIGIDEAGRGPLFGRVYAAAVVLPFLNEDNDFQPELLKDSKKFTSKRKINEAYEHIKEHAIAYSVQYCDEKEIDKLNIRRATHKAMHNAVKSVIQQIQELAPHYNSKTNFILCVDGNDFTPYTSFNIETQCIEQYHHICIKGGDNSYCHIAAASILAKVERDAYIDALCDEHPYIDEHYGIASNKGYGAKNHIDGIENHGITQWHRKTFGICKNY
jgi:ribonuclease HII